MFIRFFGMTLYFLNFSTRINFAFQLCQLISYLLVFDQSSCFCREVIVAACSSIWTTCSSNCLFRSSCFFWRSKRTRSVSLDSFSRPFIFKLSAFFRVSWLSNNSFQVSFKRQNFEYSNFLRCVNLVCLCFFSYNNIRF